MGAAEWKTIGTVDRARLSEARLQAHFVAQWLARAARAYIQPLPGDSHTNLGWDAGRGGFATQALPDNLYLVLKFSPLALALVHTGGSEEVYALGGRTDAKARVWLGEAFARRGLDATALDAQSPYDMPVHAIAQGGAYATGLAGALEDLAHWYANANCVLGRVRQALIVRKLDAPPVRCWPHHFDLDTLLSLDGGRTLGIGFSPGDEYYGEPYFYMSIYPEPDVSRLPKLPPIGHWHEHEFAAAVATASRIVAAKDQAAETEHLLLTAVDVGLTAMAK